MTCRKCKFLDVPLDKGGRRVPRKDLVYPCTVDIPEPVLPVSVTVAYNWRWPPHKRVMSPDEGEGCPLQEELK